MERIAETGKQHEHSLAIAGHGRYASPSADALPPALELQQLVGNQAMQELLRGGFIQAKLAISSPDDPEERQADDVAHTIMRKSAGAPSSTPCSCSGEGEMCEECQQKQSAPALQRRASAPSAPARAPHIVSDVLRSPGHPLDSATRAFFEPRFGRDFSDVRVHADGPAADSARSVNAVAYTAGQHLVFDRGQYAPHSAAGAYLLAHELTHVVQQTGAAQPIDSVDNANSLSIESSGEADAERAVRNIEAGRPPGRISSHRFSVQRQGFFGVPEELGNLEDLGKPGELPQARPIPQARPLPANDNAIPRPLPANDNAIPRPTPQAKPGFGPLPIPPVAPFPMTQPQPSPDNDERRRDPQCGTKQLPLTLVTFLPGPLGQGGRVKASPLTKCPGNTRGSQPDGTIYSHEFECINAAIDRGETKKTWVRAHILHGETESSGPFNLHGPGNDIRNLIITDKSINTLMSTRAEQPVIDSVYRNNAVMWYDSRVDSYEPGKASFAQSVTVSVGFYDTNTNTEGPPVPFLGGTFTLKNTPPNCPPPSATPTAAQPTSIQGVTPPAPQGATATTPISDLEFQSTFKICIKELPSRAFDVKNGGLEVSVFADWFDASGENKLDSSACPFDHYFVLLEQSGLLWGFNQYSQEPIRIPVGQRIQPLKWTGLKSDKYRLKIYVDGRLDAPASGAGAGSRAPELPPPQTCCLQGDITVSTFSAPALPPGEILA